MTRDRKLAALLRLAEMQKDAALTVLSAAEHVREESALRLTAMDTAAMLARQSAAEATDPMMLRAQDRFAAFIRHKRHDLDQDLTEKSTACTEKRLCAARAFGQFQSLLALNVKLTARLQR
ncbi:MAG: hypothetical protein R3E44_03475 [Paracoccaceae bacterium]